MSTILPPLEEIKTRISSGDKANKSFAYSTLLTFQEESNSSPAFMNALIATCRSLLPLIVTGIQDDDEEIAAKSLKCLGFMIYHPSIVGTMVVNEANLVIESLMELILKTQIKSVCNLGVWCISIQQLDSTFLAAHFPALLHAVVHALDNPLGSLSTTFEAIQAVMKLAEQLGEKMNDCSSIWAPPIYRRLLSIDKKERDMSERCLLKIRPIIIPPPPLLSRVLAKDVKKTLLSRMRELLNEGTELHTIRAWGWYIRILGSHSMKDKQLVNDMLKIPERTFSHIDPQVQIASQVAWEGLIDALIQSLIPSHEKNAVEGKYCTQMAQTSKPLTLESQGDRFSKSIRLTMTPLVAIMLSKCDVSTHLSCLNTWFYLLHKLDVYVNETSVIKLVFEPILELVFKLGHETKTIVLRDTCMNLFHDFILTKCKNVEYESSSQLVPLLSVTASMGGSLRSSSYSWRQYPVKWLPWNLNLLDFFLKMIYVIITPASLTTISYENKSYAYESGLRLFTLVLKGVQMELKGSSSNYDDLMLCLITLSRFLKKIYEDVIQEGCDRCQIGHFVLNFIRATTEELEHEILGSSLYKVALDLNYVASQSIDYTRYTQILNIQSIAVMEMVSPVVYLVVLYFCVAAQSTLAVPPADVMLQEMQKYFQFVYTSFEPLESLLATVSLLYKHIGNNSLKLWTVISKGLINCLVRGLPKLRTESESSLLTAICHLLCYPFIAYTSDKSRASPHTNIELQYIVEEAWEELYGTVITLQFKSSVSNILPKNLCSMLDAFLDDKFGMFDRVIMPELNCADFGVNFLPLFGNTVKCVVEHITTTYGNLGEKRDGDEDGCKLSGRFNYIMRLAARFMQLSWIKLGNDSQVIDSVISRVFSTLAHFINCLHLNQDILAVIEMIWSPLIPWIHADTETLNESITDELQNLWAEIISSLQRSRPPITFDHAFLKFSAHLLEKTLHHPNPSISGPTISLWKQFKIDSTHYPKNWIDFLEKGELRQEESIESPPRYKVTSKSGSSSKRIELTKSVIEREFPHSMHKRKKAELTEHQREVRRAQQGRERDCGRHGPGIKTYTCVDFSQGTEDSQER